ncbi:MAG TPA: 3'-5' exonuclease [Dissulfurispiraceae bacterium]|nr:3'-5' exonuclease [Dissulfurispiraceae bacterium]
MTTRPKRRIHSSIDETMAITHANYVAIDIKISGPDEERDSICSIGAILMSGGRIELGETFYKILKPEEFSSERNVALPGIASATLVPEPDLAPVLAEFLALADNDILAGHLVATDLAFLRNEVKRLIGTEVRNPVIDTYQIYHWLMRQEASGTFYTPENVKLYEVASQLGIAVSSNHDSMNDAFITAQILQRLMPMLMKAGVKTVGDLLRIGNPSTGLS